MLRRSDKTKNPHRKVTFFDEQPAQSYPVVIYQPTQIQASATRSQPEPGRSDDPLSEYTADWLLDEPEAGGCSIS
ncbi:hypothetical protein [Legionella sp. CNM-4043-24]|uniref:hypothetical protein n=1 Tax=Legionella sp. CNM-4043-24 TaxID=3421646 RepID=UPI00403AA5F4